MSGWLKTRLIDCCDIVSGSTPSTAMAEYWGGDICWATPQDLSKLRGSYISDTPRKLTAAGLASCAATLLPAHAVLFSSRAPIGHVAINTVPMATNQGFKNFVPRPDRLDSKFLYYWLRSNRSYLKSLGNGATFKEVSKSVIGRVEIPLPPLSEQRRIAEILDRADALRAKRRAALAQLDTLAQAIFLDMFGDPAMNPRGWPEGQTLGEVADIVSGVTKGRNLAGKPVRRVPYLAVSNVHDQILDLSVLKSIDATPNEIERYRLVRHDLLLTEGGDPDKLGRGTLWNDELPECIHQNHIFRVRLTTNAIHPVFLSWMVASRRGKRYFLRSAKQTTGIASINMTQLRGFPLLVPPVDLQLEFVARLGKVSQMRAAFLTQARVADALFASLQHRAFRGEL